jgi:hypothetical protein
MRAKGKLFPQKRWDLGGLPLPQKIARKAKILSKRLMENHLDAEGRDAQRE